MKSAVETGIDSAHSVTIEEAWSECSRELQVRERCFDNWVTGPNAKLSWADARDRISRMVMAATILSIIADEPKLAEKLIVLAKEKLLAKAEPATDAAQDDE